MIKVGFALVKRTKLSPDGEIVHIFFDPAKALGGKEFLERCDTEGNYHLFGCTVNIEKEKRLEEG